MYFLYGSGFQRGSPLAEGSCTVFGGVASRYFMYTAAYICFVRVLDGGRGVIVGCYNGSP